MQNWYIAEQEPLKKLSEEETRVVFNKVERELFYKYDKVSLESFLNSIFKNYVQKEFETNKPNLVLNLKVKEEVHSYAHQLDDKLIQLIKNGELAMVSPCGYYGKVATKKKLDTLHAMVVDVDGMYGMVNFEYLLHDCESEYFPKPTFIVHSAHGCHLYYVFKKPIKFNNCNKEFLTSRLDTVAKVLACLVYSKNISNRWIKVPDTDFYKVHPDTHSIVQNYRMPEGKNKIGLKNVAYKIGDEYEGVMDLIDAMIESKNYYTHKYATKEFKKAFVELNTYFKSSCENFGYDDSNPVYINNTKVSFYIKYLEEKIVNEVKIGSRFNSLKILIIDYIKAGRTNFYIKKRIEAIFVLLNTKAINTGGEILTPADEDALYKLLYNRNVYIDTRISKDYLEASTGCYFDSSNKKDNYIKEQIKDLPIRHNNKKITVFSTRGKEVLLMWRDNDFIVKGSLKSMFKELGINHKVYEKYSKEIKAFIKRVEEVTSLTGRNKLDIFEEEFAKGEKLNEDWINEYDEYKKTRKNKKIEAKNEYSKELEERVERVQREIAETILEIGSLTAKELDEYQTLAKAQPNEYMCSKVRNKDAYDVYLVSIGLKLRYDSNKLNEVRYMTKEEGSKVYNKIMRKVDNGYISIPCYSY